MSNELVVLLIVCTVLFLLNMVLTPRIWYRVQQKRLIKSQCYTCKEFICMDNEYGMKCKMYKLGGGDPSRVVCCSLYKPDNKNVPKEIMREGR